MHEDVGARACVADFGGSPRLDGAAARSCPRGGLAGAGLAREQDTPQRTTVLVVGAQTVGVLIPRHALRAWFLPPAGTGCSRTN